MKKAGFEDVISYIPGGEGHTLQYKFTPGCRRDTRGMSAIQSFLPQIWQDYLFIDECRPDADAGPSRRLVII